MTSDVCCLGELSVGPEMYTIHIPGYDALSIIPPDMWMLFSHHTSVPILNNTGKIVTSTLVDSGKVIFSIQEDLFSFAMRDLKNLIYQNRDVPIIFEKPPKPTPA